MDEPEFLFDGGFDQGGHTAFASRHEFIFSKKLESDLALTQHVLV